MGHFLGMGMTMMTPDMDVAGPLRYGTEPKVGPRGRAVDASDSRRTDFGMDRVTPRGFDPAGWPTWGPQPPTTLLSAHIRDKQKLR